MTGVCVVVIPSLLLFYDHIYHQHQLVRFVGARKMATDSSSESTRKFWNEKAKGLFEQEWVLRLLEQVRDCLQSNADWLEIRKSSDNEAPVKMIDYACGNGIVSQALFDFADVIRGVDISDAMVDQYNELRRQSGIAPERMHAVRGDFLDPSDNDAIAGPDFHEADAIIMSMALHHCEDPQAMLSKLVDRLRRNGVLVIIDCLQDSVSDHTGAPSHAHDHYVEDKPDVSYTMSKIGFSASEMKRLFSDAGCDPETIDLHVYKSHMAQWLKRLAAH
ncbi:S-adenosyl-L-methionine-dependent methyltransferase [Annulohypoxylon truncatum]|uniref:S-adenosyl-L-methionine-dependent methyltransferase n=1 Tax=Annulohypoxylon truncatum TaxID=327061 RepID=UPI002008CB18|nr:S-adenosyl-L-methionine-dependent methyltransferase [Annulohypoxylon truncatum]KAI1209459.1 S-adenosyl-L-methionine-dependent methyltransferase [Annulohypoxylon truncatum]